MTTEPPAAPPPEEAGYALLEKIVERRPTWQRVVKWGAIALTSVVLLLGLLVIVLNTQPGRDFVTKQINKLELASGINFRFGRIEGSLFGARVLRDVQVRDTKGVFA